MKKLEFKTSLKCGGCVSTITPALNELKEVINWNVELNSPDKILTVEGDDPDENKIIEILARLGYKAEKI